MPSYQARCCCGAIGDFTTTSLDAFVRGSVMDAYKRWMQQHDGCPALYAPKPTTSSAPVANGPHTVVDSPR